MPGSRESTTSRNSVHVKGATEWKKYQQERSSMEVVLIDKFIVPEESKAEFLEAVRSSATFLRTLPGFVDGFVYERTDSESGQNVVTTAVWKDEEAFQNAKKSAAEEFKRIGFNPPEIMKKLKVEIERGVYRRSPY
jgi:heme-degrading monooxygenase HmoA